MREDKGRRGRGGGVKGGYGVGEMGGEKNGVWVGVETEEGNECRRGGNGWKKSGSEEGGLWEWGGESLIVVGEEESVRQGGEWPK